MTGPPPMKAGQFLRDFNSDPVIEHESDQDPDVNSYETSALSLIV